MPNAAVKTQDKLYYESGVWMCEKSPTGAHESSGGNLTNNLVVFTCKHCGHIQVKENFFEKGPNDMGEL